MEEKKQHAKSKILSIFFFIAVFFIPASVAFGAEYEEIYQNQYPQPDSPNGDYTWGKTSYTGTSPAVGNVGDFILKNTTGTQALTVCGLRFAAAPWDFSRTVDLSVRVYETKLGVSWFSGHGAGDDQGVTFPNVPGIITLIVSDEDTAVSPVLDNNDQDYFRQSVSMSFSNGCQNWNMQEFNYFIEIGNLQTTSTNGFNAGYHALDDDEDRYAIGMYFDGNPNSASAGWTSDSSTSFGIQLLGLQPTTCDGYDTISIQGALCHIFAYLFIPSSNSVKSFNSNKTKLESKVPWGYWSQVSTELGSVSSTDVATSSAFTMRIPHNGVTSTFAVIDMNAVSGYVPSNLLILIKTLGGIAMWALFGTWIWHLVTKKSSDDGG